MTNEEKANQLIVEAYESDPDKAIELTDEAIKLNPTNDEAYFVRGNNVLAVEGWSRSTEKERRPLKYILWKSILKKIKAIFGG